MYVDTLQFHEKSSVTFLYFFRYMEIPQPWLILLYYVSLFIFARKVPSIFCTFLLHALLRITEIDHLRPYLVKKKIRFASLRS